MRLGVEIDPVLNKYQSGIDRLSSGDQHKALARAVNRTTTMTRTQVIQATVKQSSIPRRIVAGSMDTRQVKPGGGGALQGMIIASGSPVPLKEFNAKQFGYGVKAKVWGKQMRFPGTFIWAGHRNSGKYVGAGHVFARLTSKSLPIEKQLGPSVPEEVVKDQSKAAFERTTAEVLPKRVIHEVGRLLPK